MSIKCIVNCVAQTATLLATKRKKRHKYLSEMPIRAVKNQTFGRFLFRWVNHSSNGPFTLPETDTDTETDTENKYTEPNLNRVLLYVSVQCEYLHTILYIPFFICLIISLGVRQCKHTIRVAMTTSFGTQVTLTNHILPFSAQVQEGH